MTEKRLLVVDDEADFGNFVANVAESIGYAVTVTDQPSRFQELYDRIEPTDIMVDIVMPETDGIEIVRWLAEHDNTARVFVVTGRSPHYANAAKLIGDLVGGFPLTVLSKPIGIDDLTAALNGAAS